jgi:uncharacterized protein YlxW (UPF0749 family)
MSQHPDPTPPTGPTPPPTGPTPPTGSSGVAPPRPSHLPEEEPVVTAWHRLRLMARPRATRANAFAALLALVLGFAVATQVRSTQAQGLESLRQSDLVGILDNVTQQSTRLDRSARELQATRDQLVNGSSNEAAALKAAQDRLAALRILAGTAPAKGPGVRMTIDDPDGKLTAPVLLDALEELRDAGAEAVQINSARVVASSYFGQSADGLQVDGQTVHSPYRILAIGNPQTLSAAMEIPGGISETVRQLGATVRVVQDQSLEVSALQTSQQPRYARPVPAPTPTQ